MTLERLVFGKSNLCLAEIKNNTKPNQHEIVCGARAFALGLHLMINLIISQFLIKIVGLKGTGEYYAFSPE